MACEGDERSYFTSKDNWSVVRATIESDWMNLIAKRMKNSQSYVKQAQGINEDLLVNKLYNTTVCKILLYYMN